MIVQVKNNFKAEGLVQELEEYLTKELARYEKETLSDIDRDVPRGKSGHLAGSIESVNDPDQLKVTIGTDLFYAPYQEFGTIKGYSEGGGSTYASKNELGDYPSNFIGNGIKKTGGILPKQFFFKNVRTNFFKMIDRIK